MFCAEFKEKKIFILETFLYNQMTMKYCQIIDFKGYFFQNGCEIRGDIECPKLGLSYVTIKKEIKTFFGLPPFLLYSKILVFLFFFWPNMTYIIFLQYFVMLYIVQFLELIYKYKLYPVWNISFCFPLELQIKL